MVKERRMGSKIPASYVCPVCNTVYKTKKEAENCYRFNFEAFKKGDIIDWNGTPYTLRYDLKNDGKDLCFVIDKHVPLTKALCRIDTKKESWAPLYRTCCKKHPLKRFDLANVRARLKFYKESIKTLEKVLDGN